MQFLSSGFSIFFAAATVLCAGSLQAQTAADVPTGLNGTYDLKLVSVNGSFPNFPHKQNDLVRFVIDAAKDTLCLNGTLLTSKPVMNSIGNTFTWTSNTNTIYEVVFHNGGLHEVNAMQGNASNFAGQFSGAKTSNAVDCTAASITPIASTTPAISTDVQSIFDLAAQVYPSLMVNGSALGLYEGYVYRFFAASGVYVGIKDNKIFTMGGPFGTAIKEQGTVGVVLNALQTAKSKIDAMKPTTPNAPAIPAGLYKLTLSGTYKTSGFVNISVPLNFTINDLPAPNVSDTTLIIDQVRTQLGATGISNVKVTSINNTASRVTFRVEFSATVATVGNVSYDLTYDYTR